MGSGLHCTERRSMELDLYSYNGVIITIHLVILNQFSPFSVNNNYSSNAHGGGKH